MSRYEYVGDGRIPITTSATPVAKRGFLYNASGANVTANVTWDDASLPVETAAPISPGYHPVMVRSVSTASVNGALFLITNSKIDGKQ